MSIWQVQMCKTTIQGSSIRRQVLVHNRWHLQRTTKSISYCRWHFDCRLWCILQKPWQNTEKSYASYFRCMWAPFFGEIISRCYVQPDPCKTCMLTDMLSPININIICPIQVSSPQPMQRYENLFEDCHQQRQNGHGTACTKSYMKK